MEGVLVVNGGGAALNVVDVRTLVGDDERALKLSHRRGVDAEIRLQRDRHVNALGDVDEGTTGPGGSVQRGELVVTRRYALTEVLLKNLRVLAQAGVGVGEDDTLTLKIFLDLLVDDLRLVLSGDAGDQSRLLGLGDTEAVVGVTDFLGQVFPVVDLAIRGTHVVLERIEIHVGQVGAPRRHRLTFEQLQRLQAALPHPLRLVLHLRDEANDFFVNSGGDILRVVVGVVPTVFVTADRLDDLIIGHSTVISARGGCLRHSCVNLSFLTKCYLRRTFRAPGRITGIPTGMWVVHTCPPPASVESLWTWTSRSLPKASVSASHSCGKSPATF